MKLIVILFQDIIIFCNFKKLNNFSNRVGLVEMEDGNWAPMIVYLGS